MTFLWIFAVVLNSVALTVGWILFTSNPRKLIGLGFFGTMIFAMLGLSLAIAGLAGAFK